MKSPKDKKDDKQIEIPDVDPELSVTTSSRRSIEGLKRGRAASIPRKEYKREKPSEEMQKSSDIDDSK